MKNDKINNNVPDGFEPCVETKRKETFVKIINKDFIKLAIEFENRAEGDKKEIDIKFSVNSKLPKLPIKSSGMFPETPGYEYSDTILWIIDGENNCWSNLALRHSCYKLFPTKAETLLFHANDTYDEKVIRKILGFKPRLPYWINEAEKAGWTPPDKWNWDNYEKENEECYRDPFLEWCKNNRLEISKYPNHHLAITLEDGILYATGTAMEMAKILDSFPKEKREKMFMTHSTLWLGGVA